MCANSLVFGEDCECPKSSSKSCLPAVTRWHCNTSQMEFLRWTKIHVSAGTAPRWTMWRWPHTSRSDQLCANTADLVVEQGLWPWIARKGGFIPWPLCAQPEQSGFVPACFPCKGSHVKQWISYGVARNQLLSSNPSCAVNTLGGLGQVYWHVSELP